MTNKEKKVFILAGEASGDYIGSSVMKGLKLIDEKISFFGIGGPLMIEEGLKSKYKMNDFNIIGFLNFLNNYNKLKNYVNEITKLIFFEKPIVVITIDTKGFSYELAKNLKKSFNNKPVLKGISCEFEKGKTSLIIGQTGSGKTVFLKCLLGLHKHDEGKIIFDDKIRFFLFILR